LLEKIKQIDLDELQDQISDILIALETIINFEGLAPIEEQLTSGREAEIMNTLADSLMSKEDTFFAYIVEHPNCTPQDLFASLKNHYRIADYFVLRDLDRKGFITRHRTTKNKWGPMRLRANFPLMEHMGDLHGYDS
jgi:hypothetical protein